ncbi:MAG TPA: DUF3306 domain-containing protein [Rhodocyclaceae bacterium]|nr:DUF3306 domain-containing protein [Rhodocyclaceae bacterium]
MNEMPQAVENMDSDPPRKEAFLDRWSRVKREVKAGAVPPGTVEAAEAPRLPSLEMLATQGLEADFVPFMQKGVAEATKRAAIQQLFKQPVFNVMDGLDVYIEDFNIYKPLTAAELPGLAHARAILFPEAAAEVSAEGDARQSAMAASEVKPQVAVQQAPAGMATTEMHEEESHGRS